MIAECNERELRQQIAPELLPCPFCGSTVDLCVDYASAYIACNNKYCRVLVCSHFGEDRAQKAINAWNRRPLSAPQWTTEPPKEEGWYMVCYSGKHVDCIEVTTGKGKYDSYRLGLYEEPANIGENGKRFCSIEDYGSRYDVTGWCKIDFPPLLGKESNDD